MVKIIENYLSKLQEGVDEFDPTLPNPYNFRAITLDPKVTREDRLKALEQVKKNKKYFYDAKNIIANWSLKPHPRKIECTIIAKGERVGLLTFEPTNDESLKYQEILYTFVTTWVPGYNYATRAIMKSITVKPLSKLKHFVMFYFEVHDENKAMQKVLKKLKVSPSLTRDSSEKLVHRPIFLDSKVRNYYIVKPFWWLQGG